MTKRDETKATFPLDIWKSKQRFHKFWWRNGTMEGFKIKEARQRKISRIKREGIHVGLIWEAQSKGTSRHFP